MFPMMFVMMRASIVLELCHPVQGAGLGGQGILVGPAKPCFSCTHTFPCDGTVHPGSSFSIVMKGKFVPSVSKMICPFSQRHTSTMYWCMFASSYLPGLIGTGSHVTSTLLPFRVAFAHLDGG